MEGREQITILFLIAMTETFEFEDKTLCRKSSLLDTHLTDIDLLDFLS